MQIALPTKAIGLITPSANVVVEWTAIRLMAAFPAIGLNFARTPVAGAVDPYPDGYDERAMLEAARLLAHAGPGVIVWAGSKGVQIGVDKDADLCRRIEDATGIRATTPSLALRERAERGALRHVVLVTPYTEAYQARLIAGFERIGIACVAEAHAGIGDNLGYAAVGLDQIGAMTRAAMGRASVRPDAVLAWCTNFAAAPAAWPMEDEFGLPFIDATLLGLRQALSVLDVDPAPARAWGSLFHG